MTQTHHYPSPRRTSRATKRGVRRTMAARRLPSFDGEERHIGDIRVRTHGFQHADGRIDDGQIEAPGIGRRPQLGERQ